MKDLAIRVENLSKRYRIGLREELNDTFAGALVQCISRPIHNLRNLRRLSRFDENEQRGNDIIWALKDVSFQIRCGEVFGIIGRNGAGKSTLLKILSRITPPTRGRAEIYGHLSSLLEVGTGFHQELTGRENIYLNGIILGMGRKEIDRKFDEIVDFSGVEKFIDTPVKRYSSGMKVRLAFSVAAHLEPEILLVDEVLAVGDASFQEKCLGKMGDVARQGRTVLFVSHNMAAISQLCGKALWIDKGKLRLSGAPAHVIASYLSSGRTGHSIWINEDLTSGNNGDKEVLIRSAKLLSSEAKLANVFEFDKSFNLEIESEVVHPIKNMCIVCLIRDSRGDVPWTSQDTDTTSWAGKSRTKGRYRSICQVPPGLLRPGRYFVSVGAYVPRMELIIYHENILAFDISQVGCSLNLDRVGVSTPVLPWEVRRIES